MPFMWPDSVDEILYGDQAVALAYCTPASGVVIAPLTNFGIRDREAGTVTLNSSVGAWTQRPPGRGTGPRLNHRRAAKRAARLPAVLLGWVGADGLPVVVPVEARGTTEQGMRLEAPEGAVPPGGRRAGLTAHWFAPRVIGQEQRVHTGWLEAGPTGSAPVYAPHTHAGYWFPASEPLYRLVSGGATRWRYRASMGRLRATASTG